MPASQVATVVVIFILVDLIIIPLVIRAVVASSWGSLERAWPGRPVGGGAVVREFQSVRIGSSNFGGCVHIAVDDRFLHLMPARFIRWFGAGPVSVPWESLTDVRPVRGGAYASAAAGGTRLTAPAWALELARPPDAP